MKEVITVLNMRNSDEETIKSGIPGKVLMYNAALGVYNSFNWHGKIGIFCGSGNNGGDGYALALILFENGYDVEVVIPKEKFSADGLYYYNKCVEHKVIIKSFNTSLPHYDICVDCLLGTGFKGDVVGLLADVINYINNSKSTVISVDINSGLNGDNGMTKLAVKSDLTVSIGYLKPGLYLNMAKDYIKSIVNVDIGIKAIDKPYLLLEKEDVKLKERFNFSNKGTYGYVGIMGGSDNYPGAIRLAQLGQIALYSGAGVSRLIVPDSIYELIFNNVLETTVFKMPSCDGKMIYDNKRLNAAIKGLKVLGVGVGWDQSEEYTTILEYILNNYSGILVIDADGLNTLVKMDLNILNTSKAKIILTPHLKEFSRLTGYNVSDINSNSIELVNEFVRKYNVTLLLKGPTTIVADKDNLYLVDKGSSGMATAGSGDVLTGILVGLLGYHNDDICYSVALGSFINGYAGEKAQEEYGSIGMVSSDTARMISYVLKELSK